MKSILQKQALWNIFQLEKKDESDSKNEEITKLEMKEHHVPCTLCQNILHMMDDGLPTCIHCGYMYHYIIDYSPEWKFYKRNEKNIGDPTRCGNPMNLLLKRIFVWMYYLEYK